MIHRVLRLKDIYRVFGIAKQSRTAQSRRIVSILLTKYLVHLRDVYIKPFQKMDRTKYLPWEQLLA